MGTIVGSIDHRRRPLVRIERANDEDGFLALLGTGFNGQLFMSIEDAIALGVTLRAGISITELAAGQVQRVQRGAMTICWIGHTRDVEVLVPIPSGTRPRRSTDEPVALVGTALLYPHLVLLDFAAQSIEIEAQV